MEPAGASSSGQPPIPQNSPTSAVTVTRAGPEEGVNKTWMSAKLGNPVRTADPASTSMALINVPAALIGQVFIAAHASIINSCVPKF